MSARWNKDGETAELRFFDGGWEAWNTTRTQLAVTPEPGYVFAARAELEAALRADGWEPDSAESPRQDRRGKLP